MKTLKQFSILLMLLCGSYFANAQFLCGVHAAFTQNVNPNNVASFYDTSRVDANWQISSWAWDFGDGSVATTQHPVHTYTSPGTYNVCLRVTATGIGATCHDSICHTITIGSPGCGNTHANFTGTSNGSGVVVLQSTSTGTPTGALYQWWMDGNAITNPNPNTAYTISNVSNGQHNFCLYVYVNNISTFCDSSCQSIFVGNCNITAGFQFTFGQFPTMLFYSNQNSITVTHHWDFGDGTSSTLPDPSHVFPSNPNSVTYHVCHYVAAPGTNCADTVCQNVVIPGTGIGCGNASFTQTVSGGVIHAVSNSTGVDSTTQYQWYIWGPNNVLVQTQSGQNFITSQSLPTGTYLVCLYLYSANQTFCDSVCHNITITNGNPCAGVNADWTQTYLTGNAVSFTGTNNTLNMTHHWNFGDGSTSTLPNPTHCYTTAGLFTVCHYVNIPGTICADTNCHAIQANACTPCAGFGISINWSTSPLGGFEVEAIPTLPPPSVPTTFLWNTGDTGRVIRVLQAGVYCVTATTTTGCTATACDSVGFGNPCHITVAITSQGSGFFQVLTAHATGGTSPYTFYWSNGTSTSNILTVNAPGTYCVSVFDANQCVGTACYTVSPTTGTDTICGIVFEDTNGNGILDSTEHGIAGAHVFAGNYSAFTDSFGHYTIIVPSGTYSITYCAPTGYTYTLPINPNNNGISCRGYYVNIIGNGTHCGFDFGIQFNSVSICGTVYLDANNNQVQDIGENGIPNVHVYVTGSNGHTYHAYTDVNGHYCVLVPVGTYTIHAVSNTFNTCPITPQSISVTATVTGQVLNGNDFAAYCQPGLCNLRVNITPHTTVTAGFPAWYDIQVCNIGSSVSSGTLNMFYDAALTFDHASPVQSSHNASTRTITWNVNNLLPGNCNYFWVYLDASPNVVIGQSVFTLVNITPDVNCNDINMVNNVDTVHQNATASWDPNNKLAYTTNHETNPDYQWVSSIDANQRLEYVINFQNLGNAPAVNVVVKDIISSDLDLNSFELLGTSHPGVVTNDGAELNFKFSDIMLAAASVDEPNSHGWIKFAINSVNGLAGGHVIADEADIYFDYNLPVTTNDAAVIMLDANGIDEVVSNVTVIIAPNPMNQFAEIRLNDSKSDNFRFRVTDLTGRLVAEKTSNGNSLLFERNSLAGGLYTYQVIQSNTIVAKGKLVIE